MTRMVTVICIVVEKDTEHFEYYGNDLRCTHMIGHHTIKVFNILLKYILNI